ncbi:excisionase family DNA-binding protein [Massilia sp. IC2-477]|uniref:GAF domain-containing protein n=1 Tax=Massilia sp. IC2-477 TaxID=2887198 RepID=UPI001D11E60B|nr:GAF domain-containing protein [Massilia sp. IC2-477]MCC2957976.1 excisionase family DNA-binding protein [Massilia sp. IC2-477]
MSKDDPVLTTREAAELLGVAVSTAQIWMESGALPAWKTPGGHRRVRLSAVEQLQAQQQRGAVALAAPTLPVSGALAPAFQPPSSHVLLDTPPEEVFDRLVRLAACVTECPIALVTVLAGQRQWFKARVGTTLQETPREWAFCNGALASGATFVVGDAAGDPRYAANPLVTGAPHVRFYAGVPLEDAQGRRFGTLCVLDREPRRLRERELRALQELAQIASEEMKRRG